MKVEISTDNSRLDVDFIHGFLTESYWAKGRAKSEMLTCIRNSVNFGVYLDEKQIGYARVVSDHVQFAYIMDVFIDPAHRKKGYSQVLINAILSHNALQSVRVWRLATKDAHGLYQKFGFHALQHPENMLELLKEY